MRGRFGDPRKIAQSILFSGGEGKNIYPEIEFLGMTISSHLFFGLLAALAVCVFGMFHMEKWNVKTIPLILLVSLNVVTLLFFSHLFYAISAIAEEGFSMEGFLYNFIYGGKVFYGGLFGIFVGLMIGPKVSPRSRRGLLG